MLTIKSEPTAGNLTHRVPYVKAQHVTKRYDLDTVLVDCSVHSFNSSVILLHVLGVWSKCKLSSETATGHRSDGVVMVGGCCLRFQSETMAAVHCLENPLMFCIIYYISKKLQ